MRSENVLQAGDICTIMGEYQNVQETSTSISTLLSHMYYTYNYSPNVS